MSAWGEARATLRERRDDALRRNVSVWRMVARGGVCVRVRACACGCVCRADARVLARAMCVHALWWVTEVAGARVERRGSHAGRGYL